MPIRLGELQVHSERKGQLIFSIRQMVKESSTPYPTHYPLSNEEGLFIKKLKCRHCYKYDLSTKMPNGEEKDNEENSFWWLIETDNCTRVFGD